MIVEIIILVIGIAILAAGLYYWVKEKTDLESKKIYSIVSIIGAVIIIAAVFKIAIWGW